MGLAVRAAEQGQLEEGPLREVPSQAAVFIHPGVLYGSLWNLLTPLPSSPREQLTTPQANPALVFPCVFF